MKITIGRRSIATVLGSAALASTAFMGSAAAAPAGGALPGMTPSLTQGEPECARYQISTDHWYGRNDGTVRSHSGARAVDRPFIKLIQRTLNTMGSRPNLDVDGYFGPATEGATKTLQRHLNLHGAGLVVDGMWGDKTHFAAARAGWAPLCP